MMASVDELLKKAERLAEQLRWEEAAHTARKALETAPDHRWAKDKLGWYLSRAKKHAEAITVFQGLIQEAPDHPKYPYMLGYQYYDQQDYASAIPWFRQALQLKPDYLVVLYRCGYALAQTGDIPAAEDMLRACATTWRAMKDGADKDREKQTYADACFQLGKIHSDRSQWDKARLAFEDSVQHDQADADKRYNLGKALVKLGLFADAVTHLSEANRLQRNKHYIQTYLAIACQHTGDSAQAEGIYNTIPPKTKDQFPYILQHQAELLMAQQRYADIIRILSPKLRNPNPKGEHSWYDVFRLLGEAYEHQGDVRGAYSAYREAQVWHVKSRGRESDHLNARLQVLQASADQQGVDLRTSHTEHPDRSSIRGSNLPYIKRYLPDKGYGFITQPAGDDVFMHVKNVVNADKIREGAAVEFEIVQGRKGLEAVNVRVIE